MELLKLPRVRGFINTGSRLSLVLHLAEKATTAELHAVAHYIQVPPRALHNTVAHAAPHYQAATIACNVMTHMRLPKPSEHYVLGVTLLPRFLVGSITQFAGLSGELLVQTCAAVMRGEAVSLVRNSASIREAHDRLARLRHAVDDLDQPGITYQSQLFTQVVQRYAIGFYQKWTD